MSYVDTVYKELDRLKKSELIHMLMVPDGIKISDNTKEILESSEFSVSVEKQCNENSNLR